MAWELRGNEYIDVRERLATRLKKPNGKPQFVVLRARTGWGKTAVVHGLYQALADEQPEARVYWPKAPSCAPLCTGHLGDRKRISPAAFDRSSGAGPKFMWVDITAQATSSAATVERDMRLVLSIHSDGLIAAHFKQAAARAGTQVVVGAARVGLPALGVGPAAAVGTAVDSGDAAKAAGTAIGSLIKAWKRTRAGGSLTPDFVDLLSRTNAMFTHWRMAEIPVVIAVEDLHLLPTDALELLAGLVPTLESRPLLIVGTAWPEGTVGKRFEDWLEANAAVVEVWAEGGELPATDPDTLRAITRFDCLANEASAEWIAQHEPALSPLAARALLSRGDVTEYRDKKNPALTDLPAALPHIHAGSIREDTGASKEMWIQTPKEQRNALTVATYALDPPPPGGLAYVRAVAADAIGHQTVRDAFETGHQELLNALDEAARAGFWVTDAGGGQDKFLASEAVQFAQDRNRDFKAAVKAAREKYAGDTFAGDPTLSTQTDLTDPAAARAHQQALQVASQFALQAATGTAGEALRHAAAAVVSARGLLAVGRYRDAEALLNEDEFNDLLTRVESGASPDTPSGAEWIAANWAIQRAKVLRTKQHRAAGFEAAVAGLNRVADILNRQPGDHADVGIALTVARLETEVSDAHKDTLAHSEREMLRTAVEGGDGLPAQTQVDACGILADLFIPDTIAQGSANPWLGRLQEWADGGWTDRATLALERARRVEGHVVDLNLQDYNNSLVVGLKDKQKEKRLRDLVEQATIVLDRCERGLGPDHKTTRYALKRVLEVTALLGYHLRDTPEKGRAGERRAKKAVSLLSASENGYEALIERTLALSGPDSLDASNLKLGYLAQRARIPKGRESDRILQRMGPEIRSFIDEQEQRGQYVLALDGCTLLATLLLSVKDSRSSREELKRLLEQGDRLVDLRQQTYGTKDPITQQWQTPKAMMMEMVRHLDALGGS